MNLLYPYKKSEEPNNTPKVKWPQSIDRYNVERRGLIAPIFLRTKAVIYVTIAGSCLSSESWVTHKRFSPSIINAVALLD